MRALRGSVRDIFLWGGVFAGSFLVSVALYFRSLRCFFVKDDIPLFLMTAAPWRPTWLDSIRPMISGFWRPTHQLASHFMVQAFGYKPLPFHLYSLLIHAAVATLAAIVTVKVLYQPLAFGILTALLVTAHIGAFMPCMNFVTAFDSWLAAAFLVSLIAWDFWLRKGTGGWLVLSVGAVLFALLTKETAVAIPPLLLVWSLIRGRRDKRAWRTALALVAVTAGYCIYLIHVQRACRISYSSLGQIRLSPKHVFRQLMDYYMSTYLPYVHLLEWPVHHIRFGTAVLWGFRAFVALALLAAAVVFVRNPERRRGLFFVLAGLVFLVPPSIVVWPPQSWYAYTSIVLTCIFLTDCLYTLTGRRKIALGATIGLLWVLFFIGFYTSPTLARYDHLGRENRNLRAEERRLSPHWEESATVAIFNYPVPWLGPVDSEANQFTKLFVPETKAVIQADHVTSETTHVYQFDGRTLHEVSRGEVAERHWRQL